jgi:hypothetical protein
MVKKVSKRLVIDASVARAAGGEEATNPTAENCRDFLKAVKKICHKLVMTPEIKEEWNEHQSYFAKRWRSSMVAKKKFVYRQDIAVDNELWNLIKAYSETEKQQKAMEKDLLLIEAAIATDKIVISLDERVRELFVKAAADIERLKQVAWVNPDVENREEEGAIAWLKNGAEIESQYLLGWQDESES